MSLTQPEIEACIDVLRQRLRQGQREMADWQGGTLAVSAVPGAGKSYGMAVATAIALARLPRTRSQQMVLVTFTRSAALSLKQKVKDSLEAIGLPNQGYSVQTLHSLALSIARAYPQQSGLRLNQLTLISPYQGHQLIQETVELWIQSNRPLFQRLIEFGDFDGEQTNRLQRQSVLRSELLPAIATTFIQEAKASGLTTQVLLKAAEPDINSLPLMEIGAGLYASYEQLLLSQQLIDYEDMILGALKALDNPIVLDHWQNQILAVFEDEAQDSTPLQFQLLERLADHPDHPSNLIRVGDANQAINSSFTAADPRYFREFCTRQEVLGNLARMTYAGRSSLPILNIANQFLFWVNQTQGPIFLPQIIQPVPVNDPQANANPIPLGSGVDIQFPADIYATVETIAKTILHWHQLHPHLTFAILVRENKQGQFLADVLAHPEEYHLEFDLHSSGLTIYDVGGEQQMTNIPRQLLVLLQFLWRPQSPAYLQETLDLLVRRQLIPVQDVSLLVIEPERFLYPSPIEPDQNEEVQEARRFCTKLLRARWELPQHQLISFLALALAYEPAELATADKLANRVISQTYSNCSLEAMIQALQSLLTSERFEPIIIERDQQHLCREQHITILTMHKAKGLDWDVVFIPFLHESVFAGRTGVSSQFRFLGEASLPDVSRQLIRSLTRSEMTPPIPVAWQQAQALKRAEEYRLLYVAMTRPKRFLWMSACQLAPFWWGGFSWANRDFLQEQMPLSFLQEWKDGTISLS